MVVDRPKRPARAVRFITRKWKPATGGMETYCVKLIEGIAKEVPVDLWALPGRKNGSPPTASLLLAFGLSSGVKLLLSRPTPILHLADMALWPLALLAKVRSPAVRVIFSAHGSDVTYPSRAGLKPKLYGWYLWAGARLFGASRVIANSTFIADRLYKAGFRNTRTILLASDLSFDEALDGKHDGNIFYAGRILSSKGVKFLIEEVLPHLPDEIGLSIAGPMWDEKEAALIKNDRVHYLGNLARDQLGEYYRRSLCTVVPSQLPEGFGLVVVEAARCGAIVLASDHTGLRDACADGVGQLIAATDAMSWVSAIIAIADLTVAERWALTSEICKTANAKFTWERVCMETLQQYRFIFSDGASDG